ncbi:MAG: hypothetical protein IH623_11020 [Verrucomicrobia bacterium]|nr:hypothetical protein [Verrucomicrobiota bacterium]
MRIAASKQAVVVRIPAVDLGTLCFLPEFQRLMARFRQQIKVNFVTAPHFLALSRQVVPFVLATTGDARVLHKVRRSLRAALKQHPQD